ncbi:hypothetical protein [Limnohabitans sp. 2KL-3]|uniref:hypothetical protein n=1 Tax=Limnohabitans sp. 2KL-3 TaxID=1100700 RepID=UPI000B09BD3D|nr:hypothetical protein [Limnohabitans sp. 2KL-3]
MALTSVRISGASSLYTSELTGTNLGTTEADTLKEKTDQALALASSIRDAIAAARSSGDVAFRPSDALLTLPEGLTDTLRDELFAEQIGRNFGGGALSLQQWAEAANALEAWAGKARSTLPPALGGGIQFVNGLWYVNGNSLTLSEVYLANRVNIYAQMDNLLTQSLNSIAANNDLTHTLTVGLKNLSTKLSKWLSSLNEDTVAADDTKGSWYLIGSDLYTQSSSPDYVTSRADGTGTIPWGAEWLKFVKWSKETNGDQGIASKFSSTSYDWAASFQNVNLNRVDALALRDELQSFVDSKSADNQVAQMRTESVFTQRANVLEGIGSFMKGQQSSASSAARNLAGG